MLVALLMAISGQPERFVGTALADTDVLTDLTLPGWTRDSTLNGLRIDQYRT